VNATPLEDLPAGPILVVAANDAIASGGPRWASLFLATQRLYRVRLAGPSTVEALVNEAKSLGAVAVMSSGDSNTWTLAEAAASALGIPVSHEGILNDVHDA
jgi:hypothetical protein